MNKKEIKTSIMQWVDLVNVLMEEDRLKNLSFSVDLENKK